MLSVCGWSFYIFGPKNNKFYVNFSAGENELHKIFPANSFFSKGKVSSLDEWNKEQLFCCKKEIYGRKSEKEISKKVKK